MKIWKRLGIILLISVLIEICIFNFNFLTSFYFKEDSELYIFYGSNFIDEGNNKILSENETSSTIEIYDINREVRNIYVDFEISGGDQVISVDYLLSDEGNKELYLGNNANKGTIWNNNLVTSKYSNINAYGKTNTIVLKITKDSNETLTIKSISINKPRELFFSFPRLLIILIIVFASSFFFSKLNMLSYLVSDMNKKTKILIIVSLILFQLITGFFISRVNTELVNYGTNDQYKLLTDSILNGKTSIDYPIDQKLFELDNPYDFSARLSNNIDNPLDFAYFNGQYYVYFGIAPVITNYIPYKLITGNYLPDWVMNLISFSVLSIALILLFFKVAEIHFKNIPVPLLCVLSIFAIDTCGAITLLSEPRIYTVPILYALAVSMMGICCWVYSRKEEGKINLFLAITGSLFMSLVFGSRPQLILLAFLALFIYWDYLKNIKQNVVPAIASLTPFIVVGTGIALYNKSRFGSFFDFGATYNLTFNDMTKRGFKFDRLFDGYFYYLLQPSSISGIFPFIQITPFESNYIGMLINEYSFGGLFFINPITICSILLFAFKKYFSNKKLLLVSLFLMIFGLIVITIDIQAAGLVERYFSDFSIFFILSSLIIICTICTNSSNCNAIYKVIFVLCCFALCFSFLRIFADSYLSLKTCNPFLFYKVYGLIQFWL